ncbi:hypothetical protein DEDE109153_10405 [Deinococcus deserti]
MHPPWNLKQKSPHGNVDSKALLEASAGRESRRGSSDPAEGTV